MPEHVRVELPDTGLAAELLHLLVYGPVYHALTDRFKQKFGAV